MYNRLINHLPRVFSTFTGFLWAFTIHAFYMGDTEYALFYLSKSFDLFVCGLLSIHLNRLINERIKKNQDFQFEIGI